MQLGRDFRDLLELFTRHQVEYLIVGGHAAAVYSQPRYTKDIDLWVRPSELNGSRILAALAEFGFSQLGLSARDFAQPDTVVQLGREPNRVDFLTELAGLEFDECYRRKKQVQLDGSLRVDLIARSDLLVNKRAVGRPRDLADVEEIERTPEPEF